VAAEVVYADLPLMPLVEDLAREGVVPGGTRRNLDNARGFTDQDAGISDWQMLVTADAQTSGGLLLAVSPGDCDRLEEEMARLSVPAARVGRLLGGKPGQLRVR